MKFYEAFKETFENQLIIRRKGWANKDLCVMCCKSPFMIMSDFVGCSSNDFNNITPWTPSQTDLLAEDWEIKGAGA